MLSLVYESAELFYAEVEQQIIRAMERVGLVYIRFRLTILYYCVGYICLSRKNDVRVLL